MLSAKNMSVPPSPFYKPENIEVIRVFPPLPPPQCRFKGETVIISPFQMILTFFYHLPIQEHKICWRETCFSRGKKKVPPCQLIISLSWANLSCFPLLEIRKIIPSLSGVQRGIVTFPGFSTQPYLWGLQTGSIIKKRNLCFYWFLYSLSPTLKADTGDLTFTYNQNCLVTAIENVSLQSWLTLFVQMLLNLQWAHVPINPT